MAIAYAVIWFKRQTVHRPRNQHALCAVMRKMDRFRSSVRAIGERVAAAKDNMFSTFGGFDIIEDIGEVDTSEESSGN
jgi:hypothetical protein